LITELHPFILAAAGRELIVEPQVRHFRVAPRDLSQVLHIPVREGDPHALVSSPLDYSDGVGTVVVVLAVSLNHFHTVSNADSDKRQKN